MIKSKIIIFIGMLCCVLFCACTPKGNTLDNVAILSNTFTYTGEEILPAFSDLPSGTSYKIYDNNNNETTIKNAGEYVVVLKNGKFKKEFQIVVNKKQVSLILQNKTVTYSGTSVELTPVINQEITEPYSLSVLYNGSEVAPINVGTYSVIATLESENYFANAEATLTINKAPCSLEISETEYTYTGENITPTFLTNCNEEYIICTQLIGCENSISVGSYEIKAKVESANYFFEKIFNFEITPKHISLSLTQTSFIYSGNEINALEYISCSEHIDFKLTEPVSLIDAGTYTITIVPESNNYSGELTTQIVIQQKIIYLSLTPQTVTYNGEVQSFKTDNLYSYIVSYNKTPIEAGTYEVSIEIDENNFIGSQTTTLTIEPKEVELSLVTQTYTYSGYAIEPKFNENYCVNLTFYRNEIELDEIMEVGSYQVYAQINELNFKGSAIFNIEVTPKVVSITLNQTIYEFSGAEIALDYSVSDNAPVSITYINGTTAVASVSEVGEYVVIIKTNSKNFTGSLSQNIHIVISEQNKFSVAFQTLASYEKITASGTATFKTAIKTVTYSVKKEYCLTPNGFTYFEQYFCSTLGYESFEFFLTSQNKEIEFERNNTINNSYSEIITGNRENDVLTLGLLPFKILENAIQTDNIFSTTTSQNELLSSYYSYLTGESCTVSSCVITLNFSEQNKLTSIESYVTFTKESVTVTEQVSLMH